MTPLRVFGNGSTIARLQKTLRGVRKVSFLVVSVGTVVKRAAV